MAESSWPSPASSRAVTDLQHEQLFSQIAQDGVFGSPQDTAVVFGDATGRQVKVRANKFAHLRGHGWTSGTTDIIKTITANASGSTRIDLVVLGLSRSTWDATCYVKAGTPGAGAPALQQDTGTTGIYEIALATVTVVNNAATIQAADVTCVARYIPSEMGLVGGRTYPGSAALTGAIGATMADTGIRTSSLALLTGHHYLAEALFTLTYSATSDVWIYMQYQIRKPSGTVIAQTDFAPFPVGSGISPTVRVTAEYEPAANELIDLQLWALAARNQGTQFNWIELMRGANTVFRVFDLGPTSLLIAT